jgi:hypothetical protein
VVEPGADHQAADENAKCRESRHRTAPLMFRA